MGASICRPAQGGIAAEPDSCGQPANLSGRGSHFPTLVVEVSHSQSLQSLRRLMQWWFVGSDHYVMIVLLANFNKSTKTLVIEKWIEEASTFTLQPKLDRTITIAQLAGSSVASCQVFGTDLVLEFEHLMLRAPESDETNITISTDALKV